MGKKIRIISGKEIIEAELNDSKTASGIESILPVTSRVNRWGGRNILLDPLLHGL